MKHGFRLSATTLAIMLACGVTAHAGNVKPSHKESAKNANANLLLHDAPRANFAWDPTAPILPTNYSQFLNWAEDINAAKSNDHAISCWSNKFCLSGLVDLDLMYFDSRPNGLGPTASLSGIGVRPMFGGPAYNQFVGSINNANLIADYLPFKFSRLHADVDYVSGSAKANAYVEHLNSYSTDWADNFHSAASIHLDELYAVISDPESYPLYLKVGRMYLDFGQYSPNGYGLPTITPSLTQLLTQTRTGGAQLGFGLENGLYGSATWSMAQQSLGNFEALINGARNYSARLGFSHEYMNSFLRYINANVSFLWDLRDADYVNASVSLINDTFFALNAMQVDFLQPVPFTTKRQHAFAAHIDTKLGASGQFGLMAEGVAATGKMNNNNPHSSVWAAVVDASYSFPTFNHDSSLDVSYQMSGDSKIVQGSKNLTGTIGSFPLIFPFGPFGYSLPRDRFTASYIFKVFPHLNTALQWVRDRDFNLPNGTGEFSDFGILRLDFEF